MTAISPLEKQITALTFICDVYLEKIEYVRSWIAKGADGLKNIHQETDMDNKVVSPLIVAIKLLHPKSDCSSNIMTEIFDILLDSVSDMNYDQEFSVNHVCS